MSFLLPDPCGVRVEMLQDISEEDVEGEGVEWTDPTWDSARGAFAGLWDSIHGTGAWEANAWVWVLSFRRVEGGAP